jgi:hypothetical protein
LVGLCFDAAGEYLVPDPDEWATISEAFALLEAGASYRTIIEETGLAVARSRSLLTADEDIITSLSSRRAASDLPRLSPRADPIWREERCLGADGTTTK